MSSVHHCWSSADFRQIAKRRLPSPLFHYIDGGADDEWTLRENTAAFDRYRLLPRQMVDNSSIDLSTRLLGIDLALPLILSPTGVTRLFHHDRELAVARAAAAAGVAYSLSTMATTSIEDIARMTTGPKIFQIYMLRDRGLTAEFIRRAKAAKYDALCLTVDTPLAGHRERDLSTGMVMPPRLTPASLLSFAAHPHWTFNYLRDNRFTLANVAHRVDALAGGPMSLIDYVNSQFDRSVTWEDAAWMAREWGGPFIVKGLLSAEDAKRAVQSGATAVMISNHGGRQLDSAPAPVDCVAPIRDAVGRDLELIVDGGVRRGTHLIKAMALGADAVSFGRPYLYALASGGQAGVDRLLALFRDEVARSLALLGVTSVRTLDQSSLFLGPKSALGRGGP